MTQESHSPSVRLVTAVVAALVLLIWFVAVPGTLPANFIITFSVERTNRIPISAGLSCLVFLLAVFAFWRGPRRERWCAALILLFSGYMFAVTAESLWAHINART